MQFASRTGFYIFILGALAVFHAGNLMALEGDLQVSNAVISKHPLAGRPSGGYFVLQNKGDSPRVLTHVSSEGAARIEMHETLNENGRMKMVHREEMIVPAKGKVIFKQGGKHLMVFGLKAEGETLRVVMTFKDGGSVTENFALKSFKKKKASHH